MRFIADWQECMARTERLLSSSEPCFLSRIGGSDTNAVAALLEARENGLYDTDPHVMRHLPTVQRYNGYYDTTEQPESYIRYLETMLGCYERSRDLFVCNYQLLSMYLRETLHPSFYREEIEGRRGFELLVERIGRAAPDCAAYPYQFVEKIVSHPLTLFNVFRTVLHEKKVLVIGPFSESIQENFYKKKSFFRNYVYPSFDIETCKTPITYSGLPAEFYPDKDWFGTKDSIIEEISNRKFDIALLSCGSYALPIGDYITRKMGRKAVYVGGVLQLYFGIMGRRYAGNSFFEDQINIDAFIYPVEGRRYLQHVSITPEMAREAFGAYF